MNAKRPQICDEKKKFLNNFKIGIKNYLSKRKNFYFSSEIWRRFAFTFCRYFHQNLQVLPSDSVAGNTLRFKGKKQYIFQTKFFPLEFEGILYNSVCLHQEFWHSGSPAKIIKKIEDVSNNVASFVWQLALVDCVIKNHPQLFANFSFCCFYARLLGLLYRICMNMWLMEHCK